MKQRSQLSLKFDQSDRLLEAVLKELGEVSESLLDQKPDPRVWSAKENLYHLIKAEHLAYRYLQKKLLQPAAEMPVAGWKGQWRIWKIHLFFALPFKIKAPEMVVPVDMPEMSMAELAAQWLQQRKELRDLLLAQSDEIFDKAVFNHPFAGRLTLWGMLDFFSAHLRRHQRQIRRTLAQVSASY
jgi:hypothetical protein